MSASQTRLELLIDVFEKPRQRALALPNLTPSELVDAIIQEFRELEYLSDTPADYQLLRAEDHAPLDEGSRLGQQVSKRERLILVERELPLPKDGQRPAKHIYLREQVTGRVYKLHWQPAIIGRTDKSQPHNEWVAVDLAPHKTGLRVSRRHAKITEKKGQYYIESLAHNPTAIKDSEGNTIPLDSEKQPLNHGDVIYLERSNIALKFIVREDAQPPEAEDDSEKDDALVSVQIEPVDEA